MYPIKSCAAHAAPGAWPLAPGGGGGLLLDREWAVADADGAVLTQVMIQYIIIIL